MATEVKRRRGTTTQHDSFTGAEGEITVDLTKDTLVVHDGSTQAGFPLLREDFSNAVFTTPDARYLLETNNLSDLPNKATARTNLGIGNVENTALSTYTGQGGALDNQYIANGANYITGYTETDPVFSASEAANITSTDTTQWDAAYTYSQVGHLPLTGGTITNDLTISGNLTVSGTTTTVNSETINLADNFILLNSNHTGDSPTENAGIEIKRSTDDSANKKFFWNEATDQWNADSALVATSFIKQSNSGGFLKADGTEDTSTYVEADFLSIVIDSSPSGGGDLEYDDAGQLTFTPASIPNVDNFIELTDLSVGISNPASGSGAISYSNSNGVFTYTPPDLSPYLTSYTETNDLTSAVTWANVPDANITSSSVTQHVVIGDPQPASGGGALAFTNGEFIFTPAAIPTGFITAVNTSATSGLSGGASSGDVSLTLDASALTADTTLTATDVFIIGQTGATKKIAASNIDLSLLNNDNSEFISDYTVTQADVTAHQAALSITESQISDLQTYLTAHPTISGTRTNQNNSGNSFIQTLTFDDNGHVTAVSSASASFTDTNHFVSAGSYDASTKDLTLTITGQTDPVIDLTAIDADKLDGQEGSYYLNYNNFSNTPSLNFDNYDHWTISDGTNSGDIDAGATLTVAAGTGITTTYSSSTQTLTIESTLAGGDITAVNTAAGSGLSGGASTGAANLQISVLNLTDMTADVVGGDDELIIRDASETGNQTRRKAISEIELSQFNDNLDYVDSTTLSTTYVSKASPAVGGDLDMNSNTITEVESIILVNKEGENFNNTSGRLMFDENFYGDTEYGSADVWTTNGGGLVIRNEDGWGRILSDKNMQYLNASFASITSSGNIEVQGITAQTNTNPKIQLIETDGNDDENVELMLSGGDFFIRTLNDDGTNPSNENLFKVNHEGVVTLMAQGTTTATNLNALFQNSDGVLKRRTLGSNAFNSTSYLPLTGGTLTGDVNIQKDNPTLKFTDTTTANPNNQTTQIRFEGIDSNLPTAEGLGLIVETTDTTGTDLTPCLIVSGQIYSNNLQKVFDDSYHPNADKLTTARTITLGGDLTGSASFDGSADITISAQVSNNSHTHDDRYLQLSGGSLTGVLDFNNVSGRVITITADSYLDGRDTSIYLGNSPSGGYGWDLEYQGTGSGNNNKLRFVSTNNGTPKVAFEATQDGVVNLPQSGATVNSSTIWHAGNDGSGSGLDADTVDGIQASNFLRSDTSDTMSGSLTITGTLSAAVKSFNIEHPNKKDKRLVYGVLEGPEHAVFYRGRSQSKFIDLPEEWVGLVDSNSITVQLTAIGNAKTYYFKEYKDNKIYIGSSGINWKYDYFYIVHATRVDVKPLQTVQDAN